MRDLLERHAPCVVLIDELVAYIRQFSEGQVLSGGSYDSNLSFLQALTEAAKLVPNAIVLASLPESDVEAGSQRCVAALRALEKTFGGVQALWKPVATEEAFEIVRRRLFEPIRDAKGRETVCRAFADAYVAEGAKLPAETQEGRYYDRLLQAYPLHPEVFDRLYKDWTTIDDMKEGWLNIDLLQKDQAEKELKTAEEVLPRAARECYKWLLCPVQETPTDPKPKVEMFPLTTTGGSAGGEIDRVCTENELVISTWSPIHLRTKLKELYWKQDQSAAGAAAFFEDTLRYLYMPRFKNRDVLGQAIRAGAASRDFFGTAYGQSGTTFDGFQLGSGSVICDDTLLLIEPTAAAAYEVANRAPAPDPAPAPGHRPGEIGSPLPPGVAPAVSGGSATKPRACHATAVVPAATAKMRLVEIAEEIVSVLASDPNATVRISVEIAAEFPDGASESMKRAVSENSRSLGIGKADWE